MGIPVAPGATLGLISPTSGPGEGDLSASSGPDSGRQPGSLSGSETAAATEKSGHLSPLTRRECRRPARAKRVLGIAHIAAWRSGTSAGLITLMVLVRVQAPLFAGEVGWCLLQLTFLHECCPISPPLRGCLLLDREDLIDFGTLVWIKQVFLKERVKVDVAGRAAAKFKEKHDSDDRLLEDKIGAAYSKTNPYLEELGISHQHFGDICKGIRRPGPRLAMKLVEWSGGKIALADLYSFFEQKQQERLSADVPDPSVLEHQVNG